MREVLFRGKRQKNGEWVYGDLLQIPKHELYSIMHEKEDTGNFIVDKNTIGQYTGLTDKNGTKIFEGDIVTGLFDFEFSINAVVEFRDGAFGLLANQHNVARFHPFTSVCNIEYEVIGNIHDNPELLKGAEK